MRPLLLFMYLVIFVFLPCICKELWLITVHDDLIFAVIDICDGIHILLYQRKNLCCTMLYVYITQFIAWIVIALSDLIWIFYRVIHSILLDKLRLINLSNHIYISNRKQSVYSNNVYLSLEGIKIGVPHGWVLGPLFFIIYTTDWSVAYRLTKSCYMQMKQPCWYLLGIRNT